MGKAADLRARNADGVLGRVHDLNLVTGIVDLGRAADVVDIDGVTVAEAVVARGRDHDRAVPPQAFPHPSVPAIAAVAIRRARPQRAPAVAVPVLQGEGVAARPDDAIGLVVDLVHAVDVIDPDIITRRQAMARGRSHLTRARARDVLDVAGLTHLPFDIADAEVGGRRSGHRIVDVAQVDAHRIGHQRDLGVIGLLHVLDDHGDQLLGCHLEVLNAAAAHRPGQVQHQRNFEILGGPVDLGMGADRQIVVHELAVGRQEDIGDQRLHIDRALGDDHLVLVQHKGGLVLTQGDVRIVGQIGAQGVHAHALDVGRLGVGRARGGQRRGVQSILKVHPHGRGPVDVHAPDRHQHHDGQAQTEDQRHIPAAIPEKALQPVSPLAHACRPDRFHILCGLGPTPAAIMPQAGLRERPRWTVNGGAYQPQSLPLFCSVSQASSGAK